MLGLNPLSSWAIAASIFGAFTTSSITEEVTSVESLDRSVVIAVDSAETITSSDETNFSITHASSQDESLTLTETSDAESLLLLEESSTAIEEQLAGLLAVASTIEDSPTVVYVDSTAELPVVTYSDLFNVETIIDRSGRALIIKKILR